MNSYIERTSAVEAFIQKNFLESALPGVMLGIKEGEREVKKVSFGFSNGERVEKPDGETVFGIGSITKSMTCMAILQLEDQGKLSVHDPVKMHIPEFSLPDKGLEKEITIHHLMTHTSGIPPLESFFYMLKSSIEQDDSFDVDEIQVRNKQMPAIDTFKELLAFLKNGDYTILGRAGEAFSYCNEGYALLGLIIERISNEAYEEYMKKHIFEPTGMSRTVFSIADILDENLSSLFHTQTIEGHPHAVPSPVWWDMPAGRAAGMAKSTVSDMMRYTSIFLSNGLAGGKRILSEAAVQKMITPFVKLGKERFYGYGLMIHQNQIGETLIEHSGSLKGISAQMCISLEKKQSLVLLSNHVATPVRLWALKAMYILNRESIPVQNVIYDEVQSEEQDLHIYEGVYESRDGTQFEIKKVDARLYFIVGELKEPLKYTGCDLFIDDGWEPTILKFLFRDGKVNRVLLGNQQVFKVSEGKSRREKSERK